MIGDVENWHSALFPLRREDCAVEDSGGTEIRGQLVVDSAYGMDGLGSKPESKEVTETRYVDLRGHPAQSCPGLSLEELTCPSHNALSNSTEKVCLLSEVVSNDDIEIEMGLRAMSKK
jgi:hypothetical protein